MTFLVKYGSVFFLGATEEAGARTSTWNQKHLKFAELYREGAVDLETQGTEGSVTTSTGLFSKINTQAYFVTISSSRP